MRLFLLSLTLGFFAVSAQAAERFIVTETPPVPAVCDCKGDPAACDCKTCDCQRTHLASVKTAAPATCGPNGCPGVVRSAPRVVARKATGSACSGRSCSRPAARWFPRLRGRRR